LFATAASVALCAALAAFQLGRFVRHGGSGASQASSFDATVRTASPT
jgi:hypothetical protein